MVMHGRIASRMVVESDVRSVGLSVRRLPVHEEENNRHEDLLRKDELCERQSYHSLTGAECGVEVDG